MLPSNKLCTSPIFHSTGVAAMRLTAVASWPPARAEEGEGEGEAPVFSVQVNAMTAGVCVT